MENCEEYQYKNSLNIFSLTLGPFEKEAEKKRAIGLDENIDEPEQNNENDETQADEEDDFGGKNEEEKPLVNKNEDPGNNEFVKKINESQAIKLKIYKLLGNGTIDLIWDLHEYLEYNKEKTSEFMKNI